MARRRKTGRPVNGILLLNKPVGLTSNKALQIVKHLFQAQKAGHTGSLDPLACGLLAICLGEATKVSSYVLNADKKYHAVCQLGVRTSTADAEGEVIQICKVPALSEPDIQQVLAEFTGQIEQIPPMYSAIKQNGQPLYKLARQGIEVERKPRQLTIYSLLMLHYGEQQLTLDIHCSKGTYIRTLAEDIGLKLSCGAHLASLIRTAAGPFKLDQAISLQQLETLASQGLEALDQCLLPIEQALIDWPEVELTDNSAYYLKQGQPILVPKAPTSGCVRLIAENREFLGIGQILDDGRVAPKRLIRA